jgi:hypothetical protein
MRNYQEEIAEIHLQSYLQNKPIIEPEYTVYDNPIESPRDKLIKARIRELEFIGVNRGHRGYTAVEGAIWDKMFINNEGKT